MFTYVISDDSITLINIGNGNQVCVFKEDSRFSKFKEYISSGEFEQAEKMDVKTVIEKFSKSYNVASFSSTKYPGNIFELVIDDGVGSVKLNGASYHLNDTIVNRIIKMEGEGFSAQPLVNFLSNLYDNPSKTAIDELFLFLDQTGLPITEDGCFIAYKIVRQDYMDIYSGKMSNSIGNIVEMPRFEVDDKRQNLCSSGLHFCSKGYLIHYGSANKEDDRCVLVKINPKDVVSIPADYNNAKGRTCRYEVVGEMQESDWRKILESRDYNKASVVTDFGEDFEYPEYDTKEDTKEDDNFVGNYFFNTKTRRWHDVETLKMVSRAHVCDMSGITLSELIAKENAG